MTHEPMRVRPVPPYMPPTAEKAAASVLGFLKRVAAGSRPGRSTVTPTGFSEIFLTHRMVRWHTHGEKSHPDQAGAQDHERQFQSDFAT